jgi:hypothetical protein
VSSVVLNNETNQTETHTIDFFNELQKMLNETDDFQEDTDIHQKYCLISKMPLSEFSVKLKCGHSFNYIPLYYDLVNFKKKSNNSEKSQNRLNIDELRCPFCRSKQKGILPYYDKLKLKKVNGINYLSPITVDKTINLYKNKQCEFQSNLLCINKEGNSNETIPQLSNIVCFERKTKPICIYNPTNPEEYNNYGDDKCYCDAHRKVMLQYYKQKKKEEIADIKKQERKKQKQIKQQERKKQKQINEK